MCANILSIAYKCLVFYVVQRLLYSILVASNWLTHKFEICSWEVNSRAIYTSIYFSIESGLEFSIQNGIFISYRDNDWSCLSITNMLAITSYFNVWKCHLRKFDWNTRSTNIVPQQFGPIHSDQIIPTVSHSHIYDINIESKNPKPWQNYVSFSYMVSI